MLESPTVGAEPAVTAQDRAALLEVENGELRARIEARDQRIRLLEEALRVLNANTYGPSRERLSVAAGQVELFGRRLRRRRRRDVTQDSDADAVRGVRSGAQLPPNRKDLRRMRSRGILSRNQHDSLSTRQLFLHLELNRFCLHKIINFLTNRVESSQIS
jgi:hypothetical protein